MARSSSRWRRRSRSSRRDAAGTTARRRHRLPRPRRRHRPRSRRSRPTGRPAEEPAAGGEGSVWVLLPDSASSPRWETDDRRYFERGVHRRGRRAHDRQRRETTPATQQSQAEQAIAEGASVILIVSLDTGSGGDDHRHRQGGRRPGGRVRPLQHRAARAGQRTSASTTWRSARRWPRCSSRRSTRSVRARRAS